MTSDGTRPDRDAQPTRSDASEGYPPGKTSGANAPDRDALREIGRLRNKVRDLEAVLAQRAAEIERVWRWFETDAAALRGERDQARAEIERLHDDVNEWKSWEALARGERDALKAQVERLRNAGYDHYGWQDRARKAETEVAAARRVIAAVREYVDDPGNWSALDGRRAHILSLLRPGDEGDRAEFAAVVSKVTTDYREALDRLASGDQP